ncbi:hypothetical protein KKF82_06470 [Patescibacteria group bacterium]|nr:hypothetical protein [Patescibacteria group bacterium]
MSEYWDQTEEEVEDEDERENTSGNPYVFVNGSRVDVEVGANFAATIKDIAKNAGLGKFRVLLNGDEILPSDAPEFIGENDRVELRKYDVAG